MQAWPARLSREGTTHEPASPAVVVEWVRQDSAPTLTWADLAAGSEWPDKPSPPDCIMPRSGRRRLRRVAQVFAVTLAVLLAIPVGAYLFLEFRLNHSAVLTGYPGRPAASDGVNWLIVGSDGGEQLSRQLENELHTGHILGGQPSDSIMLLHDPGNGSRPTLVSLPRDSYVPIPGYGRKKLNAAFSFGGPTLLAETVQNITGLRITHYLNIGFLGLVRVVDAVGGVRICVSRAIDDKNSGAHLSAGCHTLTGAQALAYVRDRHSFQNGDLAREQNQRLLLKALLHKTLSPAVDLNPVDSIKVALDGSGLVSVDNGTHLYDLYHLAEALPRAQTMNVPIARSATTPEGDALLWNQAQAHALFSALAQDKPVPKGGA